MTDLPTDADALDGFAYDVMQHWFNRNGHPDLIYRGINIGELLREHLATKIGRRLRHERFPETFPFEATLLVESRAARTWGWRLPWARQKKSLRQVLRSRAVSIGRSAVTVFHRVLRPAKVLCPIGRGISSHLFRTLLARPDFRLFPLQVGSPRPDVREALSDRWHMRLLAKAPAPGPPDPARLRAIRKAVLSGLRNEGVTLLDIDAEMLDGEIALELWRIDRAEYFFDRHRIKGLLIDSPDTADGLSFVLAARKRGIPTIGLQHGLDCEHGFHREAYTDSMAVWGPARRDRYRRQSRHQPDPIVVTGNPNYQARKPPTRLHHTDGYWLWVTRPHTPIKCYSPSRQPSEGLAILRALSDLLVRSEYRDERLCIKPHPSDLNDLYAAELARRGLRQRVRILDGPLDAHLPEASVVLSEDSTAAMDAMVHGKPLVHVHFAPSRPVLPLAEYGAALPAYSPDMLAEALDRVGTCGEEMLEGQRAFLRDFAGPMDGKQCDRIAEFVASQLT